MATQAATCARPRRFNQARTFLEMVAHGALGDPEPLRDLALADPAGAGTGKYRVDARETKGVQVGDHNIQHNTFS
jgi:hypothetical protein